MRENIVRIKTHDTRETYEFPIKRGEDNPQLWEVEIRIGRVESRGLTQYGLSTSKSVFLKCETLKLHGLIPKDTRLGKTVEPTRTAEDLIMELLEIVGVYPTEE